MRDEKCIICRVMVEETDDFQHHQTAGQSVNDIINIVRTTATLLRSGIRFILL